MKYGVTEGITDNFILKKTAPVSFVEQALLNRSYSVPIQTLYFSTPWFGMDFVEFLDSCPQFSDNLSRKRIHKTESDELNFPRLMPVWQISTFTDIYLFRKVKIDIVRTVGR